VLTHLTSEGQDFIEGGMDDDLMVIGGNNGNGVGQENYATGGTGVNYFQFMAGATGDLILESQGTDTLAFSLYDHGVVIDMNNTTDRQEVATWDEDDGMGGTVTNSLWITLVVSLPI
jgi:hypothetical protein